MERYGVKNSRGNSSSREFEVEVLVGLA